ncbi:hypothetical protein NVP1081O_240 [Vibrio phage 1.081.O._10N.286.52.C2]|nr:hypothetical protein NVP1081O_240 [Vibrio phage 1.081.O._10N.286.52.C2]
MLTNKVKAISIYRIGGDAWSNFNAEKYPEEITFTIYQTANVPHIEVLCDGFTIGYFPLSGFGMRVEYYEDEK